ncbi:hypothetical protein HK098_002763 [Nowakowskiella sp. JEL0407]|nr:hypothetical protein HK098_002763 [Nowakowskiella sp. JEL0407]
MRLYNTLAPAFLWVKYPPEFKHPLKFPTEGGDTVSKFKHSVTLTYKSSVLPEPTIYQKHPLLDSILGEGLMEHYEHWKAGRIDKLTIPTYNVSSGAGTGNQGFFQN